MIEVAEAISANSLRGKNMDKKKMQILNSEGGKALLPLPSLIKRSFSFIPLSTKHQITNLCRIPLCFTVKRSFLCSKQSGAVEAWWAHNPQVDGSKPSSAKTFWGNSLRNITKIFTANG